jgi:hypothetical protein
VFFQAVALQTNTSKVSKQKNVQFKYMLLIPGHTVPGKRPGFVMQVSVKNPMSTSTTAGNCCVRLVNVIAKLVMDRTVVTTSKEYIIAYRNVVDGISAADFGKSGFILLLLVVEWLITLRHHPRFFLFCFVFFSR